VHEINVRKHEGDLLRRSQAGEKAKLIVVTLRCCMSFCSSYGRLRWLSDESI
jgi:hypothetical protein